MNIFIINHCSKRTILGEHLAFLRPECGLIQKESQFYDDRERHK